MTSPATQAGVVVQSMCLMWSKRLLPAAMGARLVVSEKGDSLSPK